MNTGVSTRAPLFEGCPIDNELHRFTAMGASGSDLDFEGGLPQLPLHEGRRNRVFSSSSIQAFAGAEDEVLRGLIDSGDSRVGLAAYWFVEIEPLFRGSKIQKMGRVQTFVKGRISNSKRHRETAPVMGAA